MSIINSKEERGVSGFLRKHKAGRPVSFHMPGHKGSDLYRRCGFEDLLADHPDRDVTEISGADNLFQPEGIIAETMEKYREIYGTKATYLLINGSSAGIIASILASVKPGGKLIMARNSHKSVFNALSLGNISPVYIYPERIDSYGIAGRITSDEVSRAMEEEPDASAVILPSPNYYGICSEVDAIAGLVHERGKTLIIDQAHGAHLKLFEGSKSIAMPPSAESSGADLVINSTHKTLASLTQSAVLNVCGGDLTKDGLFRLEDRLQAIQSTSPSYILMESLDVNADIIREYGDELIDRWGSELQKLYMEVEGIPGIKVMEADGLDRTKINLDASGIGLDGAALDSELMKRGIFAELNTGDLLMCMSGIGNTGADFDKLSGALKEISEIFRQRSETGSSVSCPEGSAEGYRNQDRTQKAGNDDIWTRRRELVNIPNESELIDLADASGRVCASSLIPYPPGIPLVCPGEVITAEDVDHIGNLRDGGEKVIGIDHQGRILVGRK